MNALRTRLLMLLSMAIACGTTYAATLKIDFESLPLESTDYYNGSDLAGGFASYGVEFDNLYTDLGGDCCWNGWAYSRTTDTTTPGPTNEYSAYAGSGALGSPQYGVAFSGLDAGGGIIPLVTLPAGAEPAAVKVANTTYAALSMKFGDGFAKQFGGPSGNDPDWFLLKVEGRDAADAVVGQVSFYLADFRFESLLDDYILDAWEELDLTPLAGLGVKRLAFRLSSSDNSIFGMNTPAYVAIDDLKLQIASTSGDFNLDDVVDGIDRSVWEQHYGVTSGGGLTSGDADDDGNVDGLDFLIWQRNVALSQSTSVSVPEPETVLLFYAAVNFLPRAALCRRRLRRRCSLSLSRSETPPPSGYTPHE